MAITMSVRELMLRIEGRETATVLSFPVSCDDAPARSFKSRLQWPPLLEVSVIELSLEPPFLIETFTCQKKTKQRCKLDAIGLQD